MSLFYSFLKNICYNYNKLNSKRRLLVVLEIIAIVFSFVSVVTSLLTFLFYDRKIVKIEEARRKNEIEEQRKTEYLNRPQLKTVYAEFDVERLGYKPEEDFDIDIFFLPYESLDVDETNYTPLYPSSKKANEDDFIKEGANNDYKRPICKYKDVYNKKEEWVSFVLHLENVGKSKIMFYYLLSEAERQGSIIDAYNDYQFKVLTVTRGADHACSGKRNFIEIGDVIKVKLNFHKDFIIANGFSSPFAIYMESEDGSKWRQGIFLGKDQILESYRVTESEFSKYYQGYFLDAVMYDRIYWAKKNAKK